jgi:hypothetical protein
MDLTFLCRLRIDDSQGSSLAGIAEQIQESLELDGLEVLSVQPWSKHSQDSLDELSPQPQDSILAF